MIKSALAACILIMPAIHAATVVVTATQDTTLHEITPNGNMGGAIHVAVGAIRIESSPGTLGRARGLFRFDLAGRVPADATVTAATVNLSVVLNPGGPGSNFSLHRVLKPWGEGTKTAAGINAQPASDGEANWIAPQSPSPTWTGVGASDEADAVPQGSSAAFMSANGRYAIPSTAALVADVQSWLANPASNHGWLLRSDAEETGQTVRQFGSREREAIQVNTAPTLEITYTETAPEIRIVEFRVVENNRLFLRWTGGLPPFQVEFSTRPDTGWDVITSSLNVREATVNVPVPESFFRIVSFPVGN